MKTYICKNCSCELEWTDNIPVHGNDIACKECLENLWIDCCYVAKRKTLIDSADKAMDRLIDSWADEYQGI